MNGSANPVIRLRKTQDTPHTARRTTQWWRWYLLHDPNLESIRDTPEFAAIVAEIETDMAEQLARVREMERNGELEPIPEVSAVIQ